MSPRCEHHKKCGDCFSSEHVRRLEERIARLEGALFVKSDGADTLEGKPYLWCRACDGSWDEGAPEHHFEDCPLFQKGSSS